MFGLIRKKRKMQDLPFGKEDVGTRFVTLVIVMMAALATLALGGAEMILSLRASWVDAIEGHITIEIPATDAQGNLRGQDELDALARDVRKTLNAAEDVRAVHPLSRQDVADLIRPWIGDAAGSDDLPLPMLLGVTLAAAPDAQRAQEIAQAVRAVDSAATLEIHQGWLDDLRRFSGVLLLASAFMAFAVIACCILSVSGAVNAQLAAHQNDIDLLHLMGATDQYIGAQFVRVVAADVGRAAALGTIIGVLFLKIGGMIAGGLQSAVIPGFSWSLPVWLSFLALPAVVTALCYMAARVTVLRSLEKMP